MTWQEKLKKLEELKEWDFAIDLMQQTIKENPNNMDAYINMNYLLMNLLVEEDYDRNKHNYYESLLKQYFDESYEKFSNKAEYLFFTAMTVFMSEWYCGIESEDVDSMHEKAVALEPHNPLYTWGTYGRLHVSDDITRKMIDACTKKILENSTLVQLIKSKGSLGKYILEIHMGYGKRK